MSNTSLRKIQIPALNHANFGKAIMEQFTNIDANFQKLSNFELNAGIPGKSCLYVTINLAAPFVYPTSDINNPTANATDYNVFAAWMGHEEEFESALQDKWQQLKDSVATDYAQFKKLTGLSEFEYTRIAARMLWGSTLTFVGSDSVDPTPESLTGSLHAKYGAVEGPIECTTSDGAKETYHGNWLYEIFKMNTRDEQDARAKFFIKHALISVPGRIIVAISPLDDNTGYYPVGSLEYWYIDPRFRNAATDRDDTSVYDISCVMHWTPDGKIDDISWPGHFEILEIFPTIRRGADGKYYWFINGLNTGVPVQGPAGKDGTPAQLVICQRVENVLGYDPEKWPNGELAVGPRVGKWNVPMSAFAGDSPRNLPSRVQYVNDIPSIVPQFLDGDEWPGWPKNLVPKNTNKYSRVTDFELNVTEHTAWLGDYEDGYALSEPENLFRIYRIVGREVLWTGPQTDDLGNEIDDKNDPVNHRYDPSCDKYYFGADNVSKPNDLASIQQLIELLDGATAIVLPGPAYQYDRTDSTYWFTTLRKVEWHEPGKPMNSHSGRYMLMAYCSDEERIHNALDEHTQAGMMQRLDPYAYKSNGDNRNKPRGLMLPIGSAYAAYTDGNFDWAWASHIMHSDCGGFTGFRNGRGIQQVNNKNQRQTVASDTMHNATGRAIAAPEAQYTEVIGKRILHVGSVNDYRALNYVDNNTTTNWNGGVPGREELTQNLSGKIGNADFYGKTVSGGWFEGSELHVDEPMTITRYRDLHKRQRLLDVEGDVVIGPRMHKNGPDIIYRNRDGGLVVHSTISPDTGKDTDIFPIAYDPTMSIFNLEWYGGLELTHRAFYRTLKDAGEQSWQTIFRRWKYGENRYRAFYDVDGNAISTAGPIPRETHKHMFSFLGDDGIGARVVVAQDGFVVYNPAGTVDDGKVKSAFSVDAMGNIQTMGDEVRSNADDTLWVFHSRWTGPQNSYADMQYRDEHGVADINVDWSWLDTDEGNIKNSVFTIPGHNNLMIGTDHEVQFINTDHGSIRRLERSWRATNFYPWKDSENTELCLVPMGWLFNFGPLDDTGYHMRTFMANRDNYFGQTWGSNELMPVTAVISSDINHFYGVLHVNGVDCMAVRSKAKENSQEQNQYLSGRYGTQISHGLIVGPALRNIGNESGQQRRISERDFINSSLEMKYRSIPWQEDSNDDTSIDWGLGDDMAPMFDGEVSTPIAIWGRGSIFAEKTLIADEDLVVNRAATIRAQIRAKSFRRHNNSLNSGAYTPGEPGWSFLLDNGLSSYNAPRHTLTEGNTWPNNADLAPIIIDLGPKYTKDRLMKLGYAKKVAVTTNNKILVTPSTGMGDDRQICLFGARPDYTRIAQGQFNSLFSGHANNPGQWVLYSDGAFAMLQINILLDFSQTIGHAGNMFRKNSKYTGYGVNVPYSDAQGNGEHKLDDTTSKSLGVAPGLLANLGAMSEREGHEGGKAKSRNMLSIPIICNNVTFDANISEDYLPILPVDEHVMAIRPSGNDNGNNDRWGDSWAGTDKDFQYGLTFRLANVDNKLRLQIARAAGATMLNHKPNQILSISFTYPVKKFFDEFDEMIDPDGGEEPITQFVYYLVKDAPTTIVEADEESEGGLYLDESSANYPFNASDILAVYDKNGYSNGTPATVIVRDTEASSDELAQMLASLQSEDDAKYIIVGTTTKDISNETNPHINHKKDGVVDWSIYASKSDFESQGSGFAKRYVSTSVPFATDASNLETSWFAGKLTNNDFLSESIGVPGTIPAGTVQNSWDLTAEKAGGLTIITLRVAIDKHHKAGQKGGMAGLRLGDLLTSKFESRNIMTNAKLSLLGDSSIMPPKYDLLYFIPGMKANKTWHTDKPAWSTSENRAKGIEGDGDKQDETGIVFALKSTGEIEVVRAVNPAALCDPRSYSVDGGDQPYIMCRWVYPDDASGSNSNAGLTTTKLYAVSTGANTDKTAPVGLDDTSKSFSIFEPTASKPYIWVKTVTLGKAITDVNDPVWDNVQWSLSLVYSSGSSSGGSETSVDQNWSWQDVNEPTTTSLKTWLNDDAREELLDNISNSLNGDVGDTITVVNNYGQATIEKTATNKVQVSLIVTAYKSGASNLSHRSINFTYDASGGIVLTGTYIIGDSEDDSVDDGLLTQVFGGTYNTSTGYIVQSNGSLSHYEHNGAMDANCKAVLEGVFNAAADKGADVRAIGGRTTAAWMTFNFSNCTMKIGYQTSNTLLGIMEFYSSPSNGNDGAAFRKETGKVKITGTFQSGSRITVTAISMSDITTINFA